MYVYMYILWKNIMLYYSLYIYHLNVSYEELCWRLHRRFAVDDFLHGTRPVHRLIVVLCE